MTAPTVTINGRAYGPTDVRDDLSMNDFLREYLGMTGAKFGCGVAQCLSCAVIVDSPDGTSHTSPTCIVAAARFNGKSIRTVEGHAKNGELTSLQRAFIEHFAFQCGYCTAGFLNEGQVLLERLAKKPIARAPAGVPGNPIWHLAPREMGWEGKTLGEICAQIKDPARNGNRSLDALVEHIGEDHLVGWAWAPGYGRQPVPGTQKQAGALVEAWVKTGAECPK